MNPFPILRRELVLQCRQRITFRTRFGFGVFGLLTVVALLPSSTTARGGGGKGLLEGLITAGLLLSSFAGLAAADAFSRERREGTLGLLLLTRVTAFDLVVGKLGSVGIRSMCSLLTLCPMLMLPLLLGGVTGGEVARKALALLTSLGLSLSLGLLASTTHEQFPVVARRTLLMVVVLFLLPLCPWEFVSAPWRNAGLLSQVVALLSAGDYAYHRGGASGAYWWSIGLGIGQIIIALSVASWSLRGDHVLRVRPKLPRRKLPLSSEAAEERADRWTRGGQETDPIEWLVVRQKGTRSAFWLAAFITAFVQPWVFPLLMNFVRIPGASFLWMQVPNWALTLVSSSFVAWGASRFLSQSRRSGELELLLTTPTCSQSIISGQWAGLKRMLRWPVALMLLPSVVQLLGMHRFSSLPWYYPYPLHILFGITLIICSTAALCWLGLLYGARALTQSMAVVRTVGVVIVIPQLITYVLGTSLVMVVGYGGGYFFPRTFTNLLVIAYLLFVARKAKVRLSDKRAFQTP